MRRKAVEFHDGTAVLEGRYNQPYTVGEGKIEGWNVSEAELLVYFLVVLSVLVASWL